MLNADSTPATKSDATKARILNAARAQFAERGRDRTTIRAVAAGAGVDPALVMHYFGSKLELFAAATELPLDREKLARDVLAGDPDGLAGRMLSFALDLWQDERSGPALFAILRTAIADAAGAERVTGQLMEQLIGPLGAATGEPDGERRVALALSQGLGLAVTRHLLGIRQLAEIPDEELHRLVEPNLRRYLRGDLAKDPV